MSERFSEAMSRALAACAAIDACSLEDLIQRAVWELQSECSTEFASMALIIRCHGGRGVVGCTRELPILPVDTLFGLLVEENGARVSCRVRDHALDTVRFIDARFRTSILTRLVIPKPLLQDGEAVLWYGLRGPANPKHVELAKSIGESVSKWFGIHCNVILMLLQRSRDVAGSQQRIAEMISAVHDARAPLGALQYFLTELENSHPELVPDMSRVKGELQYVEALLTKLSPRQSRICELDNLDADVRVIVERVCARFLPEMGSQGAGRCNVRLPAEDSIRARITELELERVLSNIVSNAVRYAGSGDITVALTREEDWVVLSVSDCGPGFPPSVVEEFALGNKAHQVSKTLDDSYGWGVGLLSCRDRVAAAGGLMMLDSDTAGSTVTIKLPAVHRCKGYSSGRPDDQAVAEEEFRYGPGAHDRIQIRVEEKGAQLVIIDDDGDHSKSLARVLERIGVSIRAFEEVAVAVAYIREVPGCAVVCDAQMPDGGAERLLRVVSSEGLSARCAVMSGRVDDDTQYKFAALGAREFFSKPIELEELAAWAKGMV